MSVIADMFLGLFFWKDDNRSLLAENRSLNKGEMLLKGLIEMVTTVIGAEIGDEAVYQMVEALLPHLPILQVRKEQQHCCRFEGRT